MIITYSTGTVNLSILTPPPQHYREQWHSFGVNKNRPGVNILWVEFCHSKFGLQITTLVTATKLWHRF